MVLTDIKIFANAPYFGAKIGTQTNLLAKILQFFSRSPLAFLSSLGQQLVINRNYILWVFVTEPSTNIKCKIHEDFNTELVVNTFTK